MKCPSCGNLDSRVIDSRPLEGGARIRRRRQCTQCGKRFTTFEMIESAPLTVAKRDGSIEFFNREKLMRGIIRATTKRPVTKQMIEKIVNQIETSLKNGVSSEVTTDEIGELVMQGLQDIDQVAYIRFASVYKDFNDLESFQQELRKMQKRKKQNEKKNRK